MKVRIINGTYGYVPDPDKPFIVRPVSAGGICEVTAAEGLRLIGLGVAVSAETPPTPVATPQFPVQEPGPESNAPEEQVKNEPQETLEEATLQEDEVDLATLKLAELKAIAAQRGVNADKMRSKAEVIAAIEAAGDELPDLTPEEPVS